MTAANKSFDSFTIKLGRKIQELRELKGYSQEKLAYIASMDRVSIGYIEQGRRAPKLSTLYKLAKCLDVSVAELFKGL
jgi:transcriptional regulator with XRE-family HTH domain